MVFSARNLVILVSLILGLSACTGNDISSSSSELSSSSSTPLDGASSQTASSLPPIAVSSDSSSSPIQPSSSQAQSSSAPVVVSSAQSSSSNQNSSSVSSVNNGTYRNGDLLPLNQCDSTSQCKNLFGDTADDCMDSSSAQSLCFCGVESCAEARNAFTLVYAINAGGGAYTDSQQVVYVEDFGFNAGSLTNDKGNKEFSNTPDDVLFQRQRHSAELQYELPVTNDTYDVTIRLAENNFTEANKRIFNLIVENRTLASNLDMQAEFGNGKIRDITLKNITVSDQSLTIKSEKILYNGSIAAIIVKSISGRPTCDQACMDDLRPQAPPNTPPNTPPKADPPQQKGDLIHPGILSTQSQLDLMKKRYKDGHTLTVEQVDLMRAHVAKFNKIRNPSKDNSVAGGKNKIYCGSFNKGLDGVTTVQACNWPAEDGISAYTHALLGYITGESSHTKKAVAYMDVWMEKRNFDGFDPKGSNAPLQHGWILPWFTNAAEILRYTSNEWSAERTKKMDAFVKRIMKLVTSDVDLPLNNWMHARIEAHIAAAIWLDDKAELNKAFNRWKKKTRSYFYIDKDRNDPVPPSPTSVKSKKLRVWATNKFIEGATMETCRDINHQSLGVRPVMNSLLMAQSQKTDLLKGNDNKERILAFLKFMPTLTDEIKKANAVLKDSNASQNQKNKALATAKNPFGICKASVKARPNVELRTEPEPRIYPIAYALFNSQENKLRLQKRNIDNADSVTASRWLKKWETLLASTIEPLD